MSILYQSWYGFCKCIAANKCHNIIKGVMCAIEEVGNALDCIEFGMCLDEDKTECMHEFIITKLIFCMVGYDENSFYKLQLYDFYILLWDTLGLYNFTLRWNIIWTSTYILGGWVLICVMLYPDRLIRIFVILLIGVDVILICNTR